LNNSLKRLSVQEKTDADDEKSVAEIWHDQDIWERLQK
jgi:hypothetical protein